jgi:glutamate racemase
MNRTGNIGIFDSGLGGLWVLKHLRAELPEYDYVFYGDQAHVPYGDKTKEELFTYVTQALTHLFEKENCMGVILACNTVSSTIYDELREWKDAHYFGRILFGILRPTALSLQPDAPLVVFATTPTCSSTVYDTFLSSRVEKIVKIPMPELAGKIEKGEQVSEYIASFKDKVPSDIHRGALLCTHYGIVRDDFIKAFPEITEWSYQEESIPKYLKQYFIEFPEREAFFSHSNLLKIITSQETPVLEKFTKAWFGNGIKITSIKP